MAQPSSFRVRRGTSEQWIAVNPILGSGEPGYETDTGRCKFGDGVTTWYYLDYIVPQDEVRQMIEDAVSNPAPEDAVTHEHLTDHVNSLTPHPVYDDGPSFILLYENAKV